MVTFKTVGLRSVREGKHLLFLLATVLGTVFGHAAESTDSNMISLEDVQEASLVTVTSSRDGCFIRNESKLITYGARGMAAELIVLDVNDNETQTHIIETFGQEPL